MPIKSSIVALSVGASTLWLGACAETDSAPHVIRAEQTNSTDPASVDPSDPASSLEPVSEVDMCGLLTPDEIQAAIGRTVDEGVPDNYDEETFLCRWTVTTPPPDPELSDDLFVEVTLFPMTPSRRADLDTLAADTDTIIVSDLGVQAMINNEFVPGPMYVVLSADQYLEVDLGNFRSPPDFEGEGTIQEILIELATIAVSRV